MIRCPSCKTSNLKPTRLEADLPALGCGECGGVLLALLYYRDWAERHPEHEQPAGAEPPTELTDSHAALPCPKCSRIMTKYRISASTGNRLNLCAACDEAWLDGGEWMLLKSLELARQLPAVFTDSWQRRVRHEVNEDARRQRLAKVIGDDDTAEADRIREWVLKHPSRSEILAYLSYE